MILARRSFLSGIIAAAAAPVVIRTQGLIMPIKPQLVAAPPIVVEPLGPGIRHGGLLLMSRQYAPNHEEFRWIRETIMGDFDVDNLARVSNAGWRAVSGLRKPELVAAKIITPGFGA